MSPVVDGEKRGIPVLGWCAIACGGCLVVAIVGSIAVGFFLRNTFKNLTQQVAVIPATPSGAAPLREVWRYRAAGTLAVACTGAGLPDNTPVFVLERGDGDGPHVVGIDAAGHTKKSFPVGSDVSRIEAGRHGNGPFVMTTARFGHDLDTYDATGKHLWTYSPGDITTAVCPVDLGDGAGDDVAVGYNGRDGLQLLNPDGSPRWTARGPGNIWRMAAARTHKGAKPSIVCAGMLAIMEIYDASGRRTAQIQTSASVDQPMVSQVVAADLEGDGVDEILTTGRKVIGGVATLVVRDAGGGSRWEYSIGRCSVQGEPGVAAGRFAAKGMQVAVSSEDGTITVLDAQGTVLGKQALGERILGIRTLPGAAGQPDRLVAATSAGCTCFVWKGEAR